MFFLGYLLYISGFLGPKIARRTLREIPKNSWCVVSFICFILIPTFNHILHDDPPLMFHLGWVETTRELGVLIGFHDVHIKQ